METHGGVKPSLTLNMGTALFFTLQTCFVLSEINLTILYFYFYFFLQFNHCLFQFIAVRLSEAKRRVEAKYIFKVIQFNCERRLHERGLRSTELLNNHIRIYKSSAVTKYED